MQDTQIQEQVLTLGLDDWRAGRHDARWVAALEAGKVLYFPQLPFVLEPLEQALLRPDLLMPDVRNISLDAEGRLKGAAGDAQAALAGMVGRFRRQAESLVHALLPHYVPSLRMAPTSYRPAQVETRRQSWRADDRRLHIDAFPSRPNYGERILRVFANVNPAGVPRTWRVGEPFEDMARRFLPRARRYSPLQARLLRTLRVTKSLRSEYDHLMLQLHDGMKSDMGYQETAPQMTMPFVAGSAWICFSDQTPHAVMAGQFMLEQTLHLPADRQYNPASSPLAILGRLAGHPLV
ncbi:Kdo hydroxylase family protein [Xylophilus ampelinus]|uniref:3-deoxy-D-manno-octulosonic acid hydroxylase-like protein n=1 Tax=Xylophilus ampelinus TaxID=54067 RepID=A0A318SGS5_9BURK|nr:3-deoxy-D-manno-octulosonic acid hydroxylase-like protein [Xylophilus ampelinus]